jgi:transposase InsO family protein
VENILVAELVAAIGSQRKALEVVGLSRGTWHYRWHPRARVVDPVSQRERAYPSRIDRQDREAITALIQAGWGDGVSVDHSFATAWDDGVMVGSRRSWWRIAGAIEDQSARPVTPARKNGVSGNRREAPVLIARAPMDAWSWDITDLHGPWRGVSFKAYSVMDIFSRKIAAWRVEEREVDDLAAEMFERAFGVEGIPGAVHADSGASMRSNVVANLFADLGITKTHNRPRVSNDNPYSESSFKTMKYRPGYPGMFETIEAARAHMASYVLWHNSQHKHSGIALFSPDEVHDGTWQEKWQHRNTTLAAYYKQHPERFRTRPTTPAPARIVSINLPKPAPQDQAA